MEKDEILKKSREQKEDEGVQYAENKGRRFGLIAFSSVFCVLVIFNLFTRQNNSAPFSMFWAYAAAEAYGKYSVTKKTAYIVTTVSASVAAACFLAVYILTVLGKIK